MPDNISYQSSNSIQLRKLCIVITVIGSILFNMVGQAPGGVTWGQYLGINFDSLIKLPSSVIGRIEVCVESISICMLGQRLLVRLGMSADRPVVGLSFRKLAAAMILAAGRDLEKVRLHGDNRKYWETGGRAWWREGSVRRWVEKGWDGGYILSFYNCCEMLDLDPEKVLEYFDDPLIDWRYATHTRDIRWIGTR